MRGWKIVDIPTTSVLDPEVTQEGLHFKMNRARKMGRALYYQAPQPYAGNKVPVQKLTFCNE